MAEPLIVPRAEHCISRRDIDPDALRVLYRLQQHRHKAYLVGGGVRDLLLGRRPKDFDIGTDAHPYQIKKLFRNCWIIGRRFRLAHIKFGPKTIEVATFRRNLPEPPQEAQTIDPAAPAMREAHDAVHEPQVVASSPPQPDFIHRDNTFGTAEEDAFRRDFTINALFYDVDTRSVIDYVGGLHDLEHRVVRSIGDPNVRFVEDPVRMLRAGVFAARLDFSLDEPVLDAIARHRELLGHASAARLLEEYFKILRSGYARATFQMLHRLRLLEIVTPELARDADALSSSLERLDAWRRRFPVAPPALTNPLLMGAVLVPLGMLRARGPWAPGAERPREREHDRVQLGMLPVARKDIERLRHVLTLLPRLTDPELSPRVARGLPGRPSFADSVTWLEIFGDAPETVEMWRSVKPSRAASSPHAEGAPAHARPPADHLEAADPERRSGHRRRRRRRGRRRRGGQPGPTTE